MNLFDFLIPIALGAVLITLCVGIFALFKGGDFGRSYSNKLMRLRVALQFLAVIVLVGCQLWENSRDRVRPGRVGPGRHPVT